MAAPPVSASEPPPAIAAPAPTDNRDVIEIVGTRPGQTFKIDRRTYEVKQTPNSAQKDTYQLLRGLPAVTIGPDDTINLLGTPNVTVQVDGRSTQTDLHNLRGSDIERIEIVTNPSAQYSAQGTGGIINLVLRKKRSDGVSGSASIEGSTIGRAEDFASLKHKRGKVTYEFETRAIAGRQTQTRYHKLRSVEPVADGPATLNTEDGSSTYDQAGVLVHPKVTYDIDARTNLAAEVFAGETRAIPDNKRLFRGLTPDFESFSVRERTRETGPFLGFAVALDHKGKVEGETLKASAHIYTAFGNHARTDARFDNGDSFAIERRNASSYSEAKVDWEHPLGKNRILSTGASWNGDHYRRRYAFETNGVTGSLGPDTADRFNGTRTILAAYATFQQPIGKWTVMPGLRVERGSWHISSPGRPDSGRSRTNFFPTLHVEHALTKTLQMTLSYSKRIDRPDLETLQPYPIAESALAIRQGNPDLRDQSTDSFEINLHYRRKSLDAGVILYDREIDDVWSSIYATNLAGANVFTTINAGHQRDRGAEFDIAIPLLKRVKLNGSVNLFDSRAPIDLGVDGIRHHSTFRYTTNATLEWNGPQRGKRPGDVAQLQIQTQSPSRDFQFDQRATHWITWTYTHSFTPTFSMTATAQNVLTPVHNRHRLEAPLVQEDYDSRRSPEFRIKLLKSFGKH